ncbi:hypothetical protein DENIS_0782 [Desulfonema ishimotonii]|uniref:DUF2459 domain-containing protein n=1 Tax=Desulfonema ishimotonii TaxID=45657 RepID=A0A401FS89_9BACT|nr:TIGR02117 family protein [Desulfonema ishimotonii]GBC59841.1 hypothetical protein DENIS_0782 [Desulfonema ishimotonii]
MNPFRSHRIHTVFIIWACVLYGCASPITDLYPPEKDAAGNQTLFVVSHGWHTGLVINRAAASSHLEHLRGVFENAKYIEIGWGDEGFYRAEKITAGLVLRAIFWPTKTVLHIVAVPIPPEEYFPGSKVVELTLSEKGFEKMVRYINSSFAPDGSLNPVSLGPGLYGDSLFFRAKGQYVAFNTCNNWTAHAIRASGFPISPFYALTAGNVMYQVTHGNATRTLRVP